MSATTEPSAPIVTSVAIDPTIATPPVVPPTRRRFSGRTFDALSIRDFRFMFFGNLAQFGAMQMKQLALGILVFEFTGSFAALGIMALSHAIPGIILSPIGGVVADQAPKKTIIQVAQFLNMLNAFTVATLGLLGFLEFEYLIGSALAQGTVNAIMMPSRQSLIPDIVGPERTMNAVALSTSGENLMQLIGPAIAGFLLAVSTPAVVFGLIGFMFLFAMSVTMKLPKHPPYAYVSTNTTKRGGGAQLREGLMYTWQNSTVRTLILVNFVIIIATFPYQAMLPGFVKEVLGRGELEQGILMSVTGIGALAGSLIIASLPDRNRGKMLLASGAALAIALMIFAASTNFFVTIPIMLLVGVTFAMRRSLGQILIQTYPDPEYRGRVMAIWMMQFSIMSLATFGTGILSELLGPQLAIGGIAAVLLVILIPIAIFVPRIRNLD